MTHDRDRTASPPDGPAALSAALEKSHEVKAKVEACAEDLAVANNDVKQGITEGVTMLPAKKALDDGEIVEARVQECADDLHEVTDTLTRGIEDLKHVEKALRRSKTALAQTKIALTTARAEEEKATLRALHDATTGLPNRDLFNDRLAHGISLAKRHDWTLAVMFLDLDRFKNVNDDHGHAAGDVVLKEVARRLSQQARDEDTVCRNGGDEFLYLLMNPKGTTNVERMARAVLQDIARPVEVGGVEVVVNSSIGIAMYPDDGATGEQLIENADIAMYRAKKRACGYVLFGTDRDQAAG